MKLQKLAIRGSPFIGVFCRSTEKVSLVPTGISGKEKKTLQSLLETEIIPCSLAGSSLLGVLSIGNQKGFVVPSMIETSELQSLRNAGIRVERLEGVEALGNMVAVNDSAGICSPSLNSQTVRKIEEALQIKLAAGRLGGSDLLGAACVLNNKGFVCNANATREELQQLQKKIGLKGIRTSVNFGDPFVGNSITANSIGAVVGLHSTPHEMMAIEEALNGEA